jgi:hypothetical protein
LSIDRFDSILYRGRLLRRLGDLRRFDLLGRQPAFTLATAETLA